MLLMNDYTQILREHNLKATPQRVAITDALYLNGHMSIEALYGIMVKKFSSISLATIYKNINIMLETSFIQEVKIPNHKSIYELSKDSHSHLICGSCGEVQDITLDLSSVLQETSNLSSYKIDSTDLVLSGICKKCQAS